MGSDRNSVNVAIGLRLGSVMAVFFLVFVASAAWALPPDKPFHRYMQRAWSLESGLPQITVADVAQDAEGYIWVGTQAGVARFDGVRFATFLGGDTQLVTSAMTDRIYVDQRGDVWVASQRGVARFHRGQFHAVDVSMAGDARFYDFAEDSEGRLLVAGDAGLFYFDGQALVPYPIALVTELHSVFRYRGRLVAGGTGVIFSLSDDGWQHEPLAAALSQARVTRFTVHDDRLWAGTSAGLFHRDNGFWQLQSLEGAPAQVDIQALLSDRGGNLWVGTSVGLFRLLGTNVTEFVPIDVPGNLSVVRSMTQDHEGNVWLGTQVDGLIRLWDSWVYRYGQPEGLHHELLWSVEVGEDGAVWVGTADGLSRFYQGEFERLTQGRDQPHPHVYTLLIEPERVWAGTRSGLFWWERDESLLKQPDAFDPLLGSQVNAIIPRGDGHYWFATQHGIWRWANDTLERVGIRGMSSTTETRVLLQGSDGRLLAGSTQGLLVYSEDEEQFFAVDGGPQGQDVTALLELSTGQIVAGTLEERLWFEGAGEWLELTVDDGLPVNSAFALAEYQGQLWVAGLRGLYELPLASIAAFASGQIDRIPATMVINERGDVPGAQQGHCCNGAGNAKGVMVDGQFWLPTRSGLIRMVPERIQRHPDPPPLAVDRIRVDGVWRPLQAGDVVELSFEQRDVAFGVAVLSFQDPTSVNIRYRMLGLSDTWRTLEEPMQRQLVYTNLPSRRLELQVHASNQAGVWTSTPSSVFLHVQPRWHETAWFRLLLLGLILALIWMAVRIRVRALHRQRKALERIVAKRTEQLKQANDSLKDYSRRMEEASLTDALTGLSNRRYLLRQLPVDLAHFHREKEYSSDKSLVVVFALLDLDDFKQVNDVYGHQAGDELLVKLAGLLKSLVRQDDYVVRWGGEEFLLVLRQVRPDELDAIADRLVGAVRQMAFEPTPGKPLRVSCSMGLSSYPLLADQAVDEGWESNVILADKGLYHVKQHGKDGWCHLQPDTDQPPAELASSLDRPLDGLLDEGLLHRHCSCCSVLQTDGANTAIK